MTPGPNTYIDRVLAEYQPGDVAQQGWVGEIFEDETNALLAALLMELRGDNTTAGPAEPEYSVKSVSVESSSRERVEWGFDAHSVVVHQIDDLIDISFQKDEPITVTENTEPLVLEFGDRTECTKLWYQAPRPPEIPFKVVALANSSMRLGSP